MKKRATARATDISSWVFKLSRTCEQKC